MSTAVDNIELSPPSIVDFVVLIANSINVLKLVSKAVDKLKIMFCAAVISVGNNEFTIGVIKSSTEVVILFNTFSTTGNTLFINPLDSPSTPRILVLRPSKESFNISTSPLPIAVLKFSQEALVLLTEPLIVPSASLVVVPAIPILVFQTSIAFTKLS